MKKTLLMAAVFATLAGFAPAQTASVMLGTAAHTAVTGGTDPAFRGLGVTREATPRFIYMDRGADLTGSNANALWQVTEGGAPTQLCTEATILAALAASSGSDADATAIFRLNDCEGDAAGNIYAVVNGGIAGGSTLFREDLIRISPAGVVTVIAAGGAAGSENFEGGNAIAYDAANDRIYANVENFSSLAGIGASASSNGSGVRGIHVINNASTASLVTLGAGTLIISEADLNTAIIAGNSSGGGTGTEGNVFDLVYRPLQNDIIISNINTTADNDDIFRVQNIGVGTGTCSLFVDSNTLESSLTNDRYFGPNTLLPINDQAIDNAFMAVRDATGDIYMSNCLGGAQTANNRRSVFVISADGSSVRNIITEDACNADYGTPTGQILQGNGTNPTDRSLRFVEKTPAENSALYFTNEDNDGPEGIIRVTGFIPVAGPANTSDMWSIYQ